MWRWLVSQAGTVMGGLPRMHILLLLWLVMAGVFFWQTFQLRSARGKITTLQTQIKLCESQKSMLDLRLATQSREVMRWQAESSKAREQAEKLRLQSTQRQQRAIRKARMSLAPMLGEANECLALQKSMDRARELLP